jgi:hypothetical protein
MTIAQLVLHPSRYRLLEEQSPRRSFSEGGPVNSAAPFIVGEPPQPYFIRTS